MLGMKGSELIIDVFKHCADALLSIYGFSDAFILL